MLLKADSSTSFLNLNQFRQSFRKKDSGNKVFPAPALKSRLHIGATDQKNQLIHDFPFAALTIS
jgi:hypothetical protein